MVDDLDESITGVEVFDRVLRWLAFIVDPDLSHRNEPSGAVLAWAASHFAVVAILLTSMLSGWIEFVGVFGWVVTSSWLPLSVMFQVATGSERRAEPQLLKRLSVDLRVGFWWAQTAILVEVLESGQRIAFITAAAIVVGGRHAGLRAWLGHADAPWALTRSALSPASVGSATIFVAFSAVVIWSLGAFVDPVLRSDLGAPIPSRWSQLSITVLAIPVLVTPTLIVVETLSAIARHDDRLRRQIGVLERQSARDRLAQDLHDEAMGFLTGIELRFNEGRLRSEHLSELGRRLADLQQDLRSGAGPIEAFVCFRHMRRIWSYDPLEVEVHGDADDRCILDEPVARVLIVGLRRIVDNSVHARAGKVVIHWEAVGSRLLVQASDDGGGFSISEAFALGGGLRKLRSELVDVGGILRVHEEPAGRVIHQLEVPCINDSERL